MDNYAWTKIHFSTSSPSPPSISGIYICMKCTYMIYNALINRSLSTFCNYDNNWALKNSCHKISGGSRKCSIFHGKISSIIPESSFFIWITICFHLLVGHCISYKYLYPFYKRISPSPIENHDFLPIIHGKSTLFPPDIFRSKLASYKWWYSQFLVQMTFYMYSRC